MIEYNYYEGEIKEESKDEENDKTQEEYIVKRKNIKRVFQYNFLISTKYFLYLFFLIEYFSND